MAARDADLQAFVDAVAEAVSARTVEGEPAAVASREVFGRLAAHVGEPGTPSPVRRPVCARLPEARAGAAAAAPRLAAVAEAFRALEPRLAWYARPTADPEFGPGHANTVVVGEGGLEHHPGVTLGVTLMAPDLTYPDHAHPPEEVYLALGPGEWWNADTPWHEPGPGGLVHNPPGIRHAMRSGPAPLFAVWCLLQA